MTLVEPPEIRFVAILTGRPPAGMFRPRVELESDNLPSPILVASVLETINVPPLTRTVLLALRAPTMILLT